MGSGYFDRVCHDEWIRNRLQPLSQERQLPVISGPFARSEAIRFILRAAVRRPGPKRITTDHRALNEKLHLIQDKSLRVQRRINLQTLTDKQRHEHIPERKGPHKIINHQRHEVHLHGSPITNFQRQHNHWGV